MSKLTAIELRSQAIDDWMCKNGKSHLSMEDGPMSADLAPTEQFWAGFRYISESWKSIYPKDEFEKLNKIKADMEDPSASVYVCWTNTNALLRECHYLCEYRRFNNNPKVMKTINDLRNYKYTLIPAMEVFEVTVQENWNLKVDSLAKTLSSFGIKSSNWELALEGEHWLTRNTATNKAYKLMDEANKRWEATAQPLVNSICRKSKGEQEAFLATIDSTLGAWVQRGLRYFEVDERIKEEARLFQEKQEEDEYMLDESMGLAKAILKLPVSEHEAMIVVHEKAMQEHILFHLELYDEGYTQMRELRLAKAARAAKKASA